MKNKRQYAYDIARRVLSALKSNPEGLSSGQISQVLGIDLTQVHNSLRHLAEKGIKVKVEGELGKQTKSYKLISTRESEALLCLNQDERTLLKALADGESHDRIDIPIPDRRALTRAIIKLKSRGVELHSEKEIRVTQLYTILNPEESLELLGDTGKFMVGPPCVSKSKYLGTKYIRATEQPRESSTSESPASSATQPTDSPENKLSKLPSPKQARSYSKGLAAAMKAREEFDRLLASGDWVSRESMLAILTDPYFKDDNQKNLFLQRHIKSLRDNGTKVDTSWFPYSAGDPFEKDPQSWGIVLKHRLTPEGQEQVIQSSFSNLGLPVK